MRSKTMLIGVGVVIGLLLSAAGIVLAGSLNPTVEPAAAGSQMYTLEQIYDRLNTGAAGTKMTAFTEPTSGPTPTAGTMHTLDDIYALAWPARIPKTGQTASYAPPGDDGNLEKGVAWPNPRFTDNSNGTVTDNLTGLIWLKDANCTTFFSGDDTEQNTRIWENALTAANSLASGNCGLTDSSTVGDWRLPNVRELQSLVYYGSYSPSVPNTAGTGPWTANDPFTSVQSYYYWTSTTRAGAPTSAWHVLLGGGVMIPDYKTSSNYVWPVRDGQ